MSLGRRDCSLGQRLGRLAITSKHDDAPGKSCRIWGPFAHVHLLPSPPLATSPHGGPWVPLPAPPTPLSTN